MTPDDAREFVSSNHMAVLVTLKAGGGVQTSPVLVGLDGEGRLAISTRETAYKVANLRRDPRAVVCVMNDQFYGRWMQVEGTANVLSLPDAMEPLVDYFRRIRGEHPDWDEYRQAMVDQKRVLIQIDIERVGPDRFG